MGLLGVQAASGVAVAAPTESFSSRVLATGLGNPWEITWGPDGFLWVTEQDTGEISRVRPSDGATTTVLDISQVLLSDPGAQDGLLGMALDPAWTNGPATDTSTSPTPTTPTPHRPP
jgi:glucose/arabinose dehydrogenase